MDFIGFLDLKIGVISERTAKGERRRVTMASTVEFRWVRWKRGTF
jgi:hypothetical protein